MTNEEIDALGDEQINEMIEKLTYRSADYCSDAGCMMPIAFDYGISLHLGLHEDGMYTATVGDSWIYLTDSCGICFECDHHFTDKRPLRAAAIVYLKMKGVL